MPINPGTDFLTYAIGVGANVETQAAYAADPAQNIGVGIGIARSALFNKIWRQSSMVAAMIANFTATYSGNYIYDDGNLTEFLNNFETAVKGVFPLQIVTGNVELYVNASTGLDTNNGLTAATPFQTLQKAWQYLQASFNLNGFSCTVNCTGAFTIGLNAYGPVTGALGFYGVIFNFAAGSSITSVGAGCLIANAGAAFTVQGSVSISSTGSGSYSAGLGVGATGGGAVSIGSGGVNFGICSNSHIYGNVYIQESYSISGSAPVHINAPVANTIITYIPAIFGGLINVTLTGTPTFSDSFALAYDGGLIICVSASVSFTGSANGQRYNAANNGIVDTNESGATFLPGSIAGTVSNGGIYY
jgi:hypothetical protein